MKILARTSPKVPLCFSAAANVLISVVSRQRAVMIDS